MKHTNHDFSYYCNFLQWREHNTARTCQFQKCDHWLVNFISAISNMYVKILTCLFQRVFSTKSWAFAQCLLRLRRGGFVNFWLTRVAILRQSINRDRHNVSTIDCLNVYAIVFWIYLILLFIIYLIFIWSETPN